MKIIVTVKQVPDTSGKVAVKPDGTLNRASMQSIINPDDMNAVEAALRIKDETGCKVAAITMGPPQAESMLRELIAMGVDEGILVTAREFGGSDTYATSQILAAAIDTYGIEEDDIIFSGRQAIDGDTAQVGPQIAENLGIPQISYTEELDINDAADTVTVKRQYEDRYHMIEAKTPCLLTALQELAEPRYMHAGGIIDAYAKDITVWGFDDLKDGLNPDHIGLNGSPTKVVTSFGKMAKGAGEKLDVTPDEAVAAIIAKMEEKHII